MFGSLVFFLAVADAAPTLQVLVENSNCSDQAPSMLHAHWRCSMNMTPPPSGLCPSPSSLNFQQQFQSSLMYKKQHSPSHPAPTAAHVARLPALRQAFPKGLQNRVHGQTHNTHVVATLRRISCSKIGTSVSPANKI